MTMRVPIAAVLILATVLLGGCADPPLPPFMHEANTKRVIVGQSTEAEVLHLLGQPQQITHAETASGTDTIWRYQYLRRGTYELIPALREQLSKPALHSILTVHFNPQHIVEKVERTDREIRTPEEGGVLTPF